MPAGLSQEWHPLPEDLRLRAPSPLPHLAFPSLRTDRFARLPDPHSHRSTITNATILLALCTLSGTSATLAAEPEWSVEAGGIARAEADDNVDLTPDDEAAALRFQASPFVRIIGETETLTLEAEGSIDLIRYIGVDDRDSEDPFFRGEARKQFETSSIGLAASYRRQATTQSEVEDTGDVDTDADRQTITAAPSWAIELNETDRLTTEAGFTDVSFSNADSDTFTDYRDYRLSTEWASTLSPRWQLLLGASAQYFRPEGPSSSDSDYYRASAGAEYALSETFTLTFRGGPGIVISDDDDALFFAQVGVQYEGELTDVRVDLSHDFQPSSGGQAVQQFRLASAVDHQTTEELTLFLDAVGLHREAVGGGNDEDRDFVSLEPGIDWQVAERWIASGSYRFRAQERRSDGWAISNAALISLRYSWP